MFDHLDDPTPFVADDVLRQRVERRGRVLRRNRRAGRAVALVGVAGVLTVGGTAATRALLDDSLLPVERYEVAGVGDSDDATADPAIGSTGQAEPVAPATRPTVFLLVGLDRPRPETRADTILLVRADPTTGRIDLLSVPRDLRVGDDATGQRISATAQAGPDELVAAVETATGVGVDHYLELGTDAFVDLVDLAGGVDVEIHSAMRDPHSGLALAPSACRPLSGEEALALARSRRLEVEEQGEWSMDPYSELGRTHRQQALIGAMLRTALDRDLAPDDLLGLVGEGGTRLAVDQGLSNDDLVAWALWLTGRDPEAPVVTHPVPVVDHQMSEGQFVLIPGEGWDEAVAAFGAGGEPAVPSPDPDPDGGGGMTAGGVGLAPFRPC